MRLAPSRLILCVHDRKKFSQVVVVVGVVRLFVAFFSFLSLLDLSDNLFAVRSRN